MEQTTIRKLLQTANLYKVSKETGVSWQTLYRFKTGKVNVLQKHTKEKLSKYFEEELKK